MERIEPLRVKTPSSIIMVGPSGCGKTCFTESLLSRHHQELFVNTTSVILYCYGDWQEKFTSMKKGGVKFHEGVPELSQLETWFPRGGVLEVDDLTA